MNRFWLLPGEFYDRQGNIGWLGLGEGEKMPSFFLTTLISSKFIWSLQSSVVAKITQMVNVSIHELSQKYLIYLEICF